MLNLFKKIYFSILRKIFKSKFDPYYELLSKKRYENSKIKLLNFTFEIVDSLSFYYSYREIFLDKIYYFKSDNSSPVIIDCGANVGTSIAFFKSYYPESKIIAFEADPNVYNVCIRNINSLKLLNVELNNYAIWDIETELDFMIEGADGGRIGEVAKLGNNIVKIKAKKLSHFINQNIDFLKIDIEGAEYKVLQEISEKLYLIKNIFIEYHSFLESEQVLGNILNILKENNFRFHLKTIFAPVNPYLNIETNLGMDLQINIYATRVNL